MELIFQEVTEDKKAYLELLLLADEQEDMIDRYLDRGRMFAAYEKGHADKPEEAVAVCVVTKEDPSAVEIKNLYVVVGVALLDTECRLHIVLEVGKTCGFIELFVAHTFHVLGKNDKAFGSAFAGTEHLCMYLHECQLRGRHLRLRHQHKLGVGCSCIFHDVISL